MKVVVGSDHAGFMLKRSVAQQIASLGHEVLDRGPADATPSDYPDVAAVVARDVAARRAELGVLVCGTGIGMSIAANKVAGVRAAVCRSGFEAGMARRHNDANILCLGERVTGIGLAADIVEAFLGARFEAGRHARRLEKIRALELRADGAEAEVT